MDNDSKRLLETRRLLDGQKDDEEIVEIDAKGNVHAKGTSPSSSANKPVAFHDQKGEYAPG